MPPGGGMLHDAEPGKISRTAFDAVVRPALGARRPDVIVGPQAGVDVGVLDVGGGQAMVVTCDPFFVMPEYGWQRAAWFAIHIVASDAATSGFPPAYCALDLNLPQDMTDDDFGALWQAVHMTCSDIGMAIVTGHTGRYEGCAYPMLGGCTVMSLGPKSGYVTPSMAREGDALVITKGAAIEATGQMGVLFHERIGEYLGDTVARAAQDLFYQMSVVKDAAVAAALGVHDHGVTAMHDATERGVWGCLVEMAEAAGVGLIVEQDLIPLRPEVAAVCDMFDMDPYTASSEGTLLLACRPDRVDALLAGFGEQGIDARHIGEMTPVEEGVRVGRAGHEHELPMPASDPFWPALSRAREQEWT